MGAVDLDVPTPGTAGSEPVGAGANGSGNLLGLPVELVLTLDVPTNAGDDADPLLDLDTLLCEVASDTGDLLLTIGNAAPASATITPADPLVAVDASVGIEAAPKVLPGVEAGLSIEIDDGARVALETNLDELCTREDESLVCALDGHLGEAITTALAEAGAGLNLNGPGGNLLTIELRDGDLLVDTKLLNLR